MLVTLAGANEKTMLDGKPLYERLLAPTRIYVKPLLELAKKVPVRGFAHITGGGLTDNIPRVLPDGLGVRLESAAWRREPVWDWIQASGRIGDAEMHRTFNCGIGMVVVVARGDAEAALALLRGAGERASVIGEVVTGAGVQIA